MIPINFASHCEFAPDGCIFWATAQPTGTGRIGYGVFAPGRGQQSVNAHRFAYQWFNGPVAKGMVLDHTCGHRNCVNPAHLEPVSQRENVRRYWESVGRRRPPRGGGGGCGGSVSLYLSTRSGSYFSYVNECKKVC